MEALDIVRIVLEMRQEAFANGKFGPFLLLFPMGYRQKLQELYAPRLLHVAADQSLQQRLEAIDKVAGIQFIESTTATIQLVEVDGCEFGKVGEKCGRGRPKAGITQVMSMKICLHCKGFFQPADNDINPFCTACRASGCTTPRHVRYTHEEACELVAAEREACAKIADEMMTEDNRHGQGCLVAREIAERIRARPR